MWKPSRCNVCQAVCKHPATASRKAAAKAAAKTGAGLDPTLNFALVTGPGQQLFGSQRQKAGLRSSLPLCLRLVA